MKGKNRLFGILVLLTPIILIFIYFLIPPYYGYSSNTEHNIHSFIGYVPIWKNLTSEEISRRIIERGKYSDYEQELLKEIHFEAKINIVRLLAIIFLLLTVITARWIFLKKVKVI